MKNKSMICVAPNGAYRKKNDHPALPMTAKELAIEAKKCLAAGADMMHVHVRSSDGEHSLDSKIYSEALAEIKTAIGDKMLLQITTESGRKYHYREQFKCVYDLTPAAFSVALREALPEAEAKPIFVDLLKFAQKNNVLPQYILYAPQELAILRQLIDEKIITEERPHVLYVIGKKFAASNEAFLFTDFLSAYSRYFITNELRFMTCGFGADEHNLSLASLAAGGDVRLGFENNLFLPDGTTAEDNAALIRALFNNLRDRK